MSRRDEREVDSRLREVPGGEPPADLLDRLRADLPGGVALREDAAARRRPVALGRRWLLAASLAGMTAAGLLALHTMEPLGGRAVSTLATRERAAEASKYTAEAAERAAAAPAAGLAAGAPQPEPPSAAGDEAADGRVASSPPPAVPAPGKASPRPADQAPNQPATQPAAQPAAQPPDQEKAAARAPARARQAEDQVVVMHESALPDARRADATAAPPVAAAAAPTAVGAEASEAPPLANAAPRPASPPPAARLDARAQAAPPADAARKSLAPGPEVVVTGESALAGAGSGAVVAAEGGAAQPATPRLWASEVAELAAAYDDDPPSADGWSLAAGGTPPPPKVAGMPVHGPPAGALWVRFRVRALDPALAPAGARVEIAWTPDALRGRRLLGGEAASGDSDVFPLSAGALRRGWTAVYEVRPALAPRASFERLATLRIVTAQGAPLRELPLPLSALSRAWMDAPSTLRLPCLAAAFAERRALGAPEGYVDLVAAARSLAVARGRRDARAATLLELIVRADRVLPLAHP